MHLEFKKLFAPPLMTPPLLQAGGPEISAERAKTSGKYTLRSSGQGTYKIAPGEQLKVESSSLAIDVFSRSYKIIFGRQIIWQFVCKA